MPRHLALQHNFVMEHQCPHCGATRIDLRYKFCADCRALVRASKSPEYLEWRKRYKYAYDRGLPRPLFKDPAITLPRVSILERDGT